MTRTLPAALVAVLLAAAPAAGQQPAAKPTPTIPADGTEVFRWLLHNRGVQPLTAAGAAERLQAGQLGKVIVVVLGSPGVGVGGRPAADWAGLAVQSGGAALVATDLGFVFDGPFTRPPPGAAGLYAVIHRRFRNDNPESVYAGNSECPLAAPRRPPPGANGPEWGLFAGLKRVATNKPAYLPIQRTAGEFGSALAGFAPGTLPTTARRRAVDPTDPLYTLAVGGSQPDGVNTQRPFRFLAVADPDVFTNEMMVPLPGVAPSDNLEFADRVAAFLAGVDGGGERRACLFVEDGRVVDRFDSLGPFLKPGAPLPGLPPFGEIQEKLADAANEVVDKLQDNDTLNRLVMSGSEERREAITRAVAEVLLMLAAAWAAVAVGRRVWKARHPTNLPPPPPGGRPVIRDGDRRAGVFDRRQKELLRRDDLSEPVRAAVRELFRAAGAPADAGPRLPRVRVSDEVRRPDTLIAALKDLWAVGFGRPARVTARRWAALEPLFVRARQAHADGKWGFVWHEPDRTG